MFPQDALEAERARLSLLRDLDADPDLRTFARIFAEESPVWWIDRFVWTSDPQHLRSSTVDTPLVLWPRQAELVEWSMALFNREQRDVVATVLKGRMLGVTWLYCSLAVWAWLHKPGWKTTFAADKVDTVDKRNDPDSIFSKIRHIVRWLPPWMKPVGWDENKHSTHMLIYNPENGNVIGGEGGAQLGRGGRATMYVVDESAYVTAPEIDAALESIAGVTIHVSTPNSPDDHFWSKVERPEVFPSFEIGWEDDPFKGAEWAAATRVRYEAMGKPHIWAREHGRDATAAREGVLIPRAWVDACRKLAQVVPAGEWQGGIVAGLDIGAGKAETAIAVRRGGLIIAHDAWPDPDSIDSANRAMRIAVANGAHKRLFYDATGGLSAGVAAVIRRNELGVVGTPVNFGVRPPDRVQLEDGVLATERFASLAAFLWWRLRERCRHSWERLEGADHALEDCLGIPNDPTLIAQMSRPLWATRDSGKIVVDKAPGSAASPDRAEAIVLTLYAPQRFASGIARLGFS